MGAVPAIECDLLEGETATVGVIEDGATNKLTDGTILKGIRIEIIDR